MEKETDRAHMSAGSRPQWPQQPGLGHVEAKNQKLQPHLPCEWQEPEYSGPSSTACPAHEQEAVWEAEQPGLEHTHVWGVLLPYCPPNNMKFKQILTKC